MLPHDYYRRLPHFSPQRRFIIVTIMLMTICSGCLSAEQQKKTISLDKFVCTKMDAKLLPDGVSVTKPDQIRFVSNGLTESVFPLLQTGAPKEFVFTVVHEASCDFGEANNCKTSDKKDEADTTKYVTSGDMCKKDNNKCKSVSVSCTFNMRTVEELADARLVSFKKNIQNNGSTLCAWEAFVDNARFLLPSNTKEAKVERCAPAPGGSNTWIYVVVGLAALFVVGAVVFALVVRRKRQQQKAEAAAAAAAAAEQDDNTTGEPKSSPAMTQSMFERATKSAWRMPKFIFINAGRGASKKGGKDKKTKDADELESARDEAEAPATTAGDDKTGATTPAAKTDDDNKAAEATTPATDAATSGYGEAQTSGYVAATTSGYGAKTTESSYTVPTTNNTDAAKPAAGGATGGGGTHVRSAYFT